MAACSGVGRVAALPVVFQRHAQAIGDAVDVGVVRDDLGNVQNGAVIKARLPQRLNIGLLHRVGRQRELGGIVQHGAVGGGQGGAGVIVRKLVYQCSVLRQLTKIARMVLQSVDAVVERGDHRADHLALRAAERPTPVHQRHVKLLVIEHRLRVQAVNLHDVIDFARLAIPAGLVGGLHIASSLFLGNRFDPGRLFR